MIKTVNYLRDADFLDKLTNEKVKSVYTKIIILNTEELPIAQIQGKVTGGNVSIQGSSSVRRTGNISFLADKDEAEMTNVNNILSINKKINIFIGIENNVNTVDYDKIIWFPLGIFIITQPNISHTTSGINISLSFKDKMCLLNGECGGTLPTSITFHEYNQVIGYKEVTSLPLLDMNDYTVYGVKSGGKISYYIWDIKEGWTAANKEMIGTVVSKENTVYEIIKTLVIGYGGENPAKVFINDVPLEIKSSVRYIGSNTLYYNSRTGFYTLNQKEIIDADKEARRDFGYNESVGYIYTDFTYPGQLISNIGESVTSVLDKIKNVLGNYEYFYDTDGNFIFQEIKNYLNNSYDITNLTKDNSFIINETNYQVGFNNVSKSVYSFEQGNALITSFTNTPSYTKIKNDYHIWGKNEDGFVIHYHMAIKEKPTILNTDVYDVIFLKDNNGEYDGRLRLTTEEDKKLDWDDGERKTDYKPKDWRAFLYIQGLIKRQQNQRPDIYEQELLDMFDSIYDFKKNNGEYKENIVKNPNALSYYIDFLEPIDDMHSCAIDVVGPRTYSEQKDNIRRIYDSDVPNNILIDLGAPNSMKINLVKKCENEGQPYSNISRSVYNDLAIGEVGYSANGVLRDALYKYTSYNESISIQSMPMYYLDVNMRISVYDKESDIYGDYIINSISLPLDGKSIMSISASRALERI